jgi:hypothetical protein
MLASKAGVLRVLRTGTYTLTGLYDLYEQRAPVGRDGGHDPIEAHPGDRRWKRRVRGALENLRRSGRAQRVGKSMWAIQGSPAEPRRLLPVVTGASPREFELRLQAATDCLPPWMTRRTWCYAIRRGDSAAVKDATTPTATATASITPGSSAAT